MWSVIKDSHRKKKPPNAAPTSHNNTTTTNKMAVSRGKREREELEEEEENRDFCSLKMCVQRDSPSFSFLCVFVLICCVHTRQTAAYEDTTGDSEVGRIASLFHNASALLEAHHCRCMCVLVRI